MNLFRAKKLRLAILGLACLVFGYAAATFDAFAFPSNWTQLRSPFDVSLWLDIDGVGDLAEAWELIRSRLSSWIIAFLAGVTTAGISRHRKMIPGVCFCIGMVTTSLFPTLSTNVLWWEGFGFELLFATVLWELIAFPAFFLGAALRLPRSVPRFALSDLMVVMTLIAVLLAICLQFRLCGWPGVVLGTLSMIAYIANRCGANNSDRITTPV